MDINRDPVARGPLYFGPGPYVLRENAWSYNVNITFVAVRAPRPKRLVSIPAVAIIIKYAHGLEVSLMSRNFGSLRTF